MSTLSTSCSMCRWCRHPRRRRGEVLHPWRRLRLHPAGYVALARATPEQSMANVSIKQFGSTDWTSEWRDWEAYKEGCRIEPPDDRNYSAQLHTLLRKSPTLMTV
jgi:hypothetical protein